MNLTNMNLDKQNHIAVWENAFTPYECERLIWLFNRLNNYKWTYTRQSHTSNSKLETEDLSVNYPPIVTSLSHGEIDISVEPRIWDMFQEYAKEYPFLDMFKFEFSGLKIQKTLPSEGYHVWHADGGSNDFKIRQRAVTFILYLNDVKDGGETEFLYQQTRIPPETGKFVIFPSAYTHIHRGNPPLNGEKYILTGWISYD